MQAVLPTALLDLSTRRAAVHLASKAHAAVAQTKPVQGFVQATAPVDEHSHVVPVAAHYEWTSAVAA